MRLERRSVFAFVGASILVALLVNLLAAYIDDRVPRAREASPIILAFGVGIALFALAIAWGYARVTGERYAVSALILNSRNELLLYRHPHHKVMLPPGGRADRDEPPHEALSARLKERLNLLPAQYSFDDRAHLGFDVPFLGKSVHRVPAPFLVQREFERQRSLVRSHYDFIYVLWLKDDMPNLSAPGFDPVVFVGPSDLEGMIARKESFADVADGYRRARALQPEPSGEPS